MSKTKLCVGLAAAFPTLAFSVACIGALADPGDWTGGTCTNWSVSGGDCVCTMSYLGVDDHMQITRTWWTIPGYSGSATAQAFGLSTTRTISSGSGVTTTFNGSQDPRSTYVMTLDDSSPVDAADCASTYTSVTWTFQDVDASSSSSFAPSGPGPLEEVCDPNEPWSSSERKLVRATGTSGFLPVATRDDLTDSGRLALGIDVVAFDGAPEIRFETPAGEVVLTPEKPGTNVQMAASDLIFYSEDAPAGAAPRIVLHSQCEGAAAQPVPMAQGYEVDADLLSLLDGELAGQALVTRIVDDPERPHLLTTVRGGRFGSAVSVTQIAPDIYEITDPRLDGQVVLTRTGSDLSVDGDVAGTPIHAVLPAAR